MSVFLNGIGSVLSKIMDWIPNRKENRRNRIEKIKEEMDEISKLAPSPKLTDRYAKLADILKRLHRQAKND